MPGTSPAPAPAQAPAPAPQHQPSEEPEIRQEEAVPSDGKDHEGEQMMEELRKDKPGPPLAPDKGP